MHCKHSDYNLYLKEKGLIQKPIYKSGIWYTYHVPDFCHVDIIPGINTEIGFKNDFFKDYNDYLKNID